jgi:hypothetical protein
MDRLESDFDAWLYIWGLNLFTSKKAYKALSGSIFASPLFKWAWKSKVQNKHKFFFWLLLEDMLNTRNMLRRRHIFLDSYFCPVCIEFVEETISHLFFDCPFSQACWTFLGISWDFDIPFLDMIIQARQAFASISFREVVMIAYWSIWKLVHFKTQE